MTGPLDVLAAWREVTDKATEGPWVYGGQGWVFAPVSNPNIDDPEFSDLILQVRYSDWDGAFTATSRTAMPALLTAVENVLAMLPEMAADIPEDPGNATAQHIARQIEGAIRDALGGAQ